MQLTPKLSTRLQYIAIAFFLLLFIPSAFYNRPGTGVDNSWLIAIHLAHKFHLVFGKDFVFTYGPLGILQSRLPIAVSGIVYALFDLYFLFSMCLVLKEAFKRGFGIGTVLFILMDIYISRLSMLEDLYFFLFLFFLIGFIQKGGNLFYLAQTALLALIGFYIKVSTGLPEIMLFFVALGYAFFRKILDWRKAVFASGLFLLCLWITSIFLRVSIGPYILSSIELIDSYNDAMYMPLAGPYAPLIYAALVIFGLLTILAIWRLIYTLRKREFIGNLDEFFFYTVTGLAIFILFKHAFLRGDSHVHIFFHGIGLYIVLVYLFGPDGIYRKLAAGLCWITMLVAFWGTGIIYGSKNISGRFYTLFFLGDRAVGVKNYFRDLGNYHRARISADNRDRKPNAWKRMLGDHTVDIVPFEISKVFYNGLRYDPRPVVQTYQAYSRYLDSLNCNKYLSASAPDYVLFSLSAIDGRYPMFDEPLTKLALLSRYQLDGEIDGDLILKKKQGPVSLPQPSQRSGITVDWGDTVQLGRSNDLEYTRIEVKYSLWGKLQRLFYKPPPLTITLLTDDGRSRQYRAVKSIVEEGVPINKYLCNTNDFQVMMATAGNLTNNVKAIRIGLDKRHPGFKDGISLSNYYYSFPTAPADSMMQKVIFDKYRPILLDTTRLKETAMLEGVREFQDGYPFFLMEGWAYDDKDRWGQPSVILRGATKSYQIPTEVLSTWDMGRQVHKRGSEKTGFTAHVSKDLLEPGGYEVGLLIRPPARPYGASYYFKDLGILVKSRYQLTTVDAMKAGPLKDTSIACWSDSLQQSADDRLFLSGWAFLKHTDTRKTRINLILKGNTMVYRLNTDATPRPDIVRAFGSPLYAYSGYYAEIPRNSLPKGSYALAIEAVDEQGRVQSVKYSNINFVMGGNP